MKTCTLMIRRRRRGIALLLVLAVLAAATVMGLAILSSSSLQASVSSNTEGIASASALAESGVSYAMYQLEQLTEEEIGRGEYWAGEYGISLGADVAGTIDVEVTPHDTIANAYVISSTGNAATDAGTITRQIQAVAQLKMTFQPKYALATNGAFTVPLITTIVGPAKSSGQFRLLSLLSLIGQTALAPSFGGTIIPSGAEILPAGTPLAAPSVTSIRNYLQYTYDGQTYNAELISSGTIENVTYNPNPATNPAGIFYALGSLTIRSNTTINGTLYVKRVDTSSVSNMGRLVLDGTNIVIRAQDGYPALIVEERIRLSGSLRTANIYGLVWTADGIVRSMIGQLAWTLNIRGALLSAGTGQPIDALLPGPIRVEYAPEYLNVPDFSSSNNAPESVRILSWEQVTSS